MDEHRFDFYKLHADLREVLYQIGLLENNPNAKEYVITRIREVLTGTFERINEEIDKDNDE